MNDDIFTAAIFFIIGGLVVGFLVAGVHRYDHKQTLIRNGLMIKTNDASGNTVYFYTSNYK